MFDHARRYRGAVLALCDGLAWVLSFVFLTWLQSFVGYEPTNHWQTAIVVGAACGAAQVLISRVFRLHQGRARLASFDDAVNVGAVWMSIFVVVITLGWFQVLPLRISVIADRPGGGDLSDAGRSGGGSADPSARHAPQRRRSALADAHASGDHRRR
ncbi:MAG: hypothetical protein V9G13_10945 [Marmoricola sp.]